MGLSASLKGVGVTLDVRTARRTARWARPSTGPRVEMQLGDDPPETVPVIMDRITTLRYMRDYRTTPQTHEGHPGQCASFADVLRSDQEQRSALLPSIADKIVRFGDSEATRSSWSRRGSTTHGLYQRHLDVVPERGRAGVHEHGGAAMAKGKWGCPYRSRHQQYRAGTMGILRATGVGKYELSSAYRARFAYYTNA